MLVRQDRVQTAVAIALDVAFHAGRGGTGLASASEIADRLGAARRGLEPVLQALSRAGLLESLRGPRGGYRLGRPPRDIRLLDLVIAVDESAAGAADAAGIPQDVPLAGALQTAVIMPLWVELDAVLRERLASLTLDDLLRRASAAGLRRPAAEPLNFAI